MTAHIRWRWLLGGAVLLAVAWKVFWLWQQAFPFNADEAVVGLMARHILRGGRPTFFYGQAYMGSLDAFLVAAGFAVLGAHVWVIRLVQVLLYAGTVVLTAALAWRLFGHWESALAAALLMAVPTVNMTLYTTVSLGGYGEALLLGTALLWLALGEGVERPAGAALWGVLAGVGLWAFGLTLVYAVPAGLFLLFRWRRLGWRRGALLAAAALGGAVVGAWPWWAYGLRHGWAALLRELTGSAVAVEHVGWLARAARHALYALLFGLPVTLGLRPPWGVRLLAPVLAVGVVGAYFAAAMLWWREGHPWRKVWWLPLGVVLAVGAGFVLTAFGTDPSGRYFLPVTQMLFLGLAGAFPRLRWRGRPLGWGVVGFLVLFYAVGTAQAAANPYRMTTQFAPDARLAPDAVPQLAAFLEAHGETRGYTTYWVAYPLAFLTAERLIFVPRLPYHRDLRYTPRDDRYPPYDAQVAAARRVALVVPQHPRLETCLRALLRQHGVTWQEAVVADHVVFYALDAPLPGTVLSACTR